MRVLVVDDEADLTEAVATGLRRDGYAVDTAFGGNEAIDKLSVNAYDLVCLDLTMPERSGEEGIRLRDQRGVPACGGLLMEGHVAPVVVPACRPSSLAVQHEGEQAARLCYRRHGLGQQAPELDGFGRLPATPGSAPAMSSHPLP